MLLFQVLHLGNLYRGRIMMLNFKPGEQNEKESGPGCSNQKKQTILKFVYRQVN